MEIAKEFCDLKIYPQAEQIKQIQKCLELSRNVIRELDKCQLNTNTDTVIVKKSREIAQRFFNRSNHHLNRLALNTVIGSLCQYRFNCKALACTEKTQQLGFSADFIANFGLCCLFTKESGEALLLNNLLMLPILGTVPIDCPWDHCFNKITFMFIYRLGKSYRARIYSNWPFEKPQKQEDSWLGLNFGKHKLLFLSNGSSFSYYHLLDDRKQQNQQFKRLDAFMYYNEIFQKLYQPTLNGLIILRSQIPTGVPTSVSLFERYHFLIFLLEKANSVGLKVRIASKFPMAGKNDFEKAQSIRHAPESQEINDIEKIIKFLRHKLSDTSRNEKATQFVLNF